MIVPSEVFAKSYKIRKLKNALDRETKVVPRKIFLIFEGTESTKFDIKNKRTLSSAKQVNYDLNVLLYPILRPAFQAFDQI